MGRVNVAHFKPRSFASQPARSERGKAPLVGDLGKRIGLVHELRQLARAEELFKRRGNRLVVDQLLGHQRLDVLQAHLFLDRPLHAHQADAEMVLDELADGAHAPVAQMVNVVDGAVAVFELYEITDHFQNIFLAQRSLLQRDVELEPVIQLEPADFGEIVAIGIEKEVIEKIGGRLHGRGVSRPQAAVDFQYRILGGANAVLEQRLAQIRTDGRLLDEQDFDLMNAFSANQVELLLGDLVVALDEHFLGLRIDDVVGSDPAVNLLPGYGNLLDPGGLHLTQHRAGKLFALPDDDLVRFGITHVRADLGAEQMIGIEHQSGLARVKDDGIAPVVIVEQVLRRHAQRPQ